MSLWGTHTSWVTLLFCYTDFMATKTVAAATTISFADLKGLVLDQRNQQQLEWAHRDHRTLLMVGWVLAEFSTGKCCHQYQVITGSNRNHRFILICLNPGVCLLLVSISKTTTALEQLYFSGNVCNKNQYQKFSSRFIRSVSGFAVSCVGIIEANSAKTILI